TAASGVTGSAANCQRDGLAGGHHLRFHAPGRTGRVRVRYVPAAVVRLADIVGDVPGISMKGMSKDIPWPGSRCGWIEVYNAERDHNFRGYVHTIVVSKMLEVCSTTLPQV